MALGVAVGLESALRTWRQKVVIGLWRANQDLHYYLFSHLFAALEDWFTVGNLTLTVNTGKISKYDNFRGFFKMGIWLASHAEINASMRWDHIVWAVASAKGCWPQRETTLTLPRISNTSKLLDKEKQLVNCSFNLIKVSQTCRPCCTKIKLELS